MVESVDNVVPHSEPSTPFDARSIVRLVVQFCQTPGAYQGVIEEIGEKTAFFDDVKALGLWDEVRTGDFVHNNNGVEFNAVIESAGEYNSRTEASRLRAHPISQESMLIALASDGNVPVSLDDVLHEEIHDAQFSQNPLVRLVQQRLISGHKEDMVTPGQEWLEALPYRITNFEIHERSVFNLVEHMMTSTTNGKPTYANLNRERLIASITLIDQLRAFGVPIQDLADMSFSLGGWDETRRTYPQIAKVVAERCKERGMDASDLPSLINQYRREKQVERIQVRDLVRMRLQRIEPE